MHVLAYIYLLIERSLLSFAQLYMVGTSRIVPANKPGEEKLMGAYNSISYSLFRPKSSRPILPFHNELIPQVGCSHSSKYWHCETNYYWQESRVIKYQLSRFIQSPNMVSSGPIRYRFLHSEYQRLLVDLINRLSSLFNFLTPHMRFSSSSHTDVPVLKT
jgi:hypothetical protein